MNQLPDDFSPGRDHLARYMPAVAADTGEQTGFSFKIADVRAMIWRQRQIMLAAIGIALFIGLAISLLMTPVFLAQAKLRVDNENVKIVQGQDLDPAVAVMDTNRYLNTQALILQSRSMALKVIDDLKLARDDSFLTAMHSSAATTGVSAQQAEAERRERIVGLLTDNLKVQVPVDNRILTIGFSSPDPSVAAAVANSFARNFVANNVQSGLDSNAYARKVLIEQIDALRAQLGVAEHKAIDYARSNKLIDASNASGSGAGDAKGNSAGSSNTQSITTANLIHLNQQYTDALTARIMAQQRWRAAQTTPPLQLTEVQSSSQIQTLLGQKTQLDAQYAQLAARYSPDFPQVRQIKAQLDAVNVQLNQQIANVRKGIEYQYRVAVEQEQSLEHEREQLSGQTLEEQSRRVQLNLIARDVDSMRNQLNGLMERYNQVSSASDIVRNNISLVDVATLPDRAVSPNVPKNLGISLAVGVVLALLLAIAREAVDDTLRSPEEVESKLHLPLLGTTPIATDSDLSLFGQDRKSALAEAYYSIRASLDYATASGTPTCLQVTSSQPSEGKSTTASSLGRDYARIGKRVLLVDADLRRPTLHRYFGISNSVGFVDVLLGHKPLAECVVQGEVANLDLLPLGQIPPNPVEILSSNVIADFLQHAKSHYDIVILDTSPIMGLADAPLMARQVGSVVMIVEANRAHNGQAKAAVRRLQDSGAKIIGVVLTKFDHRIAGYSYDYHYKYYRYEDSHAQ
jgi:capsular exopolysaccharide synthesis family protein